MRLRIAPCRLSLITSAYLITLPALCSGAEISYAQSSKHVIAEPERRLYREIRAQYELARLYNAPDISKSLEGFAVLSTLTYAREQMPSITKEEMTQLARLSKDIVANAYKGLPPSDIQSVINTGSSVASLALDILLKGKAKTLSEPLKKGVDWAGGKLNQYTGSDFYSRQLELGAEIAHKPTFLLNTVVKAQEYYDADNAFRSTIDEEYIAAGYSGLPFTLSPNISNEDQQLLMSLAERFGQPSITPKNLEEISINIIARIGEANKKLLEAAAKLKSNQKASSDESLQKQAIAALEQERLNHETSIRATGAAIHLLDTFGHSVSDPTARRWLTGLAAIAAAYQTTSDAFDHLTLVQRSPSIGANAVNAAISAFTMDAVSLGVTIFSVFSSLGDSNTDHVQALFSKLEAIQSDLRGMREEMHSRFDSIDSTLFDILVALDSNFDNLQARTTRIEAVSYRALEQINALMNQVLVSEGKILKAVEAGFTEPLIDSISEILEEPAVSPQEVRAAIRKLRNLAVTHAKNPLRDPESLSSDANGPERLALLRQNPLVNADTNINGLEELTHVKFKPSDTTIANLLVVGYASEILLKLVDTRGIHVFNEITIDDLSAFTKELEQYQQYTASVMECRTEWQLPAPEASKAPEASTKKSTVSVNILGALLLNYCSDLRRIRARIHEEKAKVNAEAFHGENWLYRKREEIIAFYEQEDAAGHAYCFTEPTKCKPGNPALVDRSLATAPQNLHKSIPAPCRLMDFLNLGHVEYYSYSFWNDGQWCDYVVMPGISYSGGLKFRILSAKHSRIPYRGPRPGFQWPVAFGYVQDCWEKNIDDVRSQFSTKAADFNFYQTFKPFDDGYNVFKDGGRFNTYHLKRAMELWVKHDGEATPEVRTEYATLVAKGDPDYGWSAYPVPQIARILLPHPRWELDNTLREVNSLIDQHLHNITDKYGQTVRNKLSVGDEKIAENDDWINLLEKLDVDRQLLWNISGMIMGNPARDDSAAFWMAAVRSLPDSSMFRRMYADENARESFEKMLEGSGDSPFSQMVTLCDAVFQAQDVYAKANSQEEEKNANESAIGKARFKYAMALPQPKDNIAAARLALCMDSSGNLKKIDPRIGTILLSAPEPLGLRELWGLLGRLRVLEQMKSRE